MAGSTRALSESSAISNSHAPSNENTRSSYDFTDPPNNSPGRIISTRLFRQPNLASKYQSQRQPLCQIHWNRKPVLAEKFGKSLFQKVMVVRKPSSLFSDSTSTASSRNPPSLFSAAEETSDEEDNLSMSTDDVPPSRPLSVAIPKSTSVHGPYCPRRPNLREILSNTAEAPWTLAAFMAYLSNNHCLETLEFTMDAGRYKKHYAKMLSRGGASGSPPAKDREYVQALWVRLVDAYIRPNGSREVNLPSNVRDPLLNISSAELPPAPETLDPAVLKIYELMEESVLVPFLNSVYPQTAHPTIASAPSRSSEQIPQTAMSYEDRSTYIRRSRMRNSPPPHTAIEPQSHSYSPPSMTYRKSAPAPISTKSRFSARLAQSTSSPAASSSAHRSADVTGSEPNLSGPGMTDDSNSTESPSGDSPTTPPSPPGMESGSVKRDSGMWKKLGRLSGMKQKSSGKIREEQ